MIKCQHKQHASSRTSLTWIWMPPKNAALGLEAIRMPRLLSSSCQVSKCVQAPLLSPDRVIGWQACSSAMSASTTGKPHTEAQRIDCIVLRSYRIVYVLSVRILKCKLLPGLLLRPENRRMHGRVCCKLNTSVSASSSIITEARTW